MTRTTSHDNRTTAAFRQVLRALRGLYTLARKANPERARTHYRLLHEFINRLYKSYKAEVKSLRKGGDKHA